VCSFLKRKTSLFVLCHSAIFWVSVWLFVR
jgi:hypothetical protein